MSRPSTGELARRIGEGIGPELTGQVCFRVTRLDRDGRRRVAGWDTEWYEVSAYYTAMGTPLDGLEAALKTWPGVVRTTRVTGFPAQIRDEDWPGWTRRRDRHNLRPQVLALITGPLA